MTRAVPYDRELEAPIRAYIDAAPHDEPPAEQLIDAATRGTSVVADDRTIAGPSSAEAITMTVFRDARYDDRVLPAIYYLHGGGLVAGTRGRVAGFLATLAAEGLVGATVEYRLAPQASFADAAEDCYAGVIALHDSAAELRLDTERFVIGGASAGGGLAAAVALAARDRGGPELAGLLLDSPMLDDRNDTVSAHQFATGGIWSAERNAAAWSAALGDGDGDGWSRGATPARAGWLGDLPPALINAGSAEVFRDETVAFANGIWRDGGRAELHVWSGACHAFEALGPGSAIARSAWRCREEWLTRLGMFDRNDDDGRPTEG
jgi:acetyl esterase/lipase